MTSNKKKKPYYFGGLKVIKIDMVSIENDFMETSNNMNVFADYDFGSGNDLSHGGDNSSDTSVD